VTPLVTPLAVDGGLVVAGNRWDLVPDGALDDPTSVTVVVTHFDDERRLALVLAALERQDHPAELTHVVVADDGSPTPPTMPVWSRPSPRLVRQEDLGFRAAAARNVGAAAGDGEVLVFLDGDTVPSLDFVRRLSAWPAALPDALAVGTRHHVDLNRWDTRRLVAWLDGSEPAPSALTDPAWLDDGYRASRSLLDADDHSYRFVISAVMACSRRLFDELGGFDERFVGYGGEDWELAFRAANAGAVLVHEPRAVAWHDGPDQGVRAPDPEAKALERHRLDELVPVGRERPRRGARYVDVVVSDVWPGAATEPPTADVLARARFHVERLAPVELTDDAMVQLIDPLERRAAGEVTVRAGGRIVVRATSTRALRRSTRWSEGDPRALIGPLFGVIDIDAHEIGIDVDALNRAGGQR